MKHLILALLMTLSVTAFAQTDDKQEDKPAQQQKKSRCSKFYFDLSTGINNNGGLLGVGADYHLSSDFSLNAGVGSRTTWGYKGYLGGKIYLRPCHMGWALGGGGTFSTGIPQLTTDLATTAGTQEVTLNCLPQFNIFAAAYKYWRLGKRNNRIYLELGWSKGVSSQKFRQVSGAPLTNAAAAGVRALAPGGLIVGLGFSFGG